MKEEIQAHEHILDFIGNTPLIKLKKIAQGLSQEVLVGLKLTPSTSYDLQNAGFTPTYDMTPGSSEQPIKW